jgi:Txe/YoeB family toxin of Txe-Axe toxin-antitoxin module
MRRIAFVPEAFADFNDWAVENNKIHARIVELIRDIGRNPFSGIGNPNRSGTSLRACGRDALPASIVWFIK